MLYPCKYDKIKTINETEQTSLQIQIERKNRRNDCRNMVTVIISAVRNTMSLLYVNENSACIGIEANRFVVKYADGMKKMIPAETLESIAIMGYAQMTTQCVRECLRRGIPVSYYSKGGSYFGRLQSTGHINAKRQRQQCALYQSDFALQFSKKIIRAKLKNQLVVLRRYEKVKIVP